VSDLRLVDDHLADVLTTVGPMPPIQLQLLDAHGCTLAEDVTAPTALPAFDNSAMDGYAVRVADVASAGPETPVRLPVVGDIAAGSGVGHTVSPGLCLRIMTGAPVPPGADAVVPVEWTDGGIATVTIRRSAPVGQHIRPAGEDVAEGQVVLPAGTHLGAAQLALAAAVGRDRVLARPRPRVVVLSTGSELVEPGQVVGHGQLPDSNSFALAAAVREAGAVAYRVGIVPDEPRILLDTLEDQLVRADLVVTSGGVSVGAFDVVKEVLSGLGTVRFERVAMQPGMPQAFGTIGPDRTPIFGLPGNPVSTFVSFEVFVRPALRRMRALEPLHRPVVCATLTEPVRSPAGKRQYVRARLGTGAGGGATVTPVGGSGSHLLAGLAAADSLVVVPEPVTEVPVGSTVDVMVLERRRG
jgi:molybdopterin molybdotransferase